MPFSLTFTDQKPAIDLNQVLYAVKRTEDGLGVDFEFSDGRAVSRKSFRFKKNSYLWKLTSEVVASSAPLNHYLAWRGGFGDRTVHNAHTVQQSLHYDSVAAKLLTSDAGAAKDGTVTTGGRFTFAGLQDPYFAAVALPAAGTYLEIQTWSDKLPVTADDKEGEPHVGAGVGGLGTNSSPERISIPCCATMEGSFVAPFISRRHGRGVPARSPRVLEGLRSLACALRDVGRPKKG